jgi:Lon protease-like protein
VAASEGMQADHREAKAKDDAAVAVLQIVQQQYSSNVDKARDAADAAKQEAAQAANAMAQIQNIRG